MQFLKYDLGHRKAGEIVEVTLAHAANVRLMDSSNFSSYQSGRQHRFFGGYVTRSPWQHSIPSSGHWCVVVDLGGHAGRIRASVRTLPGLLPPAQDAPLSSVPSLIQGRRERPGMVPDDDSRKFDVFISHASEDKDEVVRPLAHALNDAGLRVWYDEFEFKIGDSLRRKIDQGLASSKFGVIVMSQAFFSKGWTNYELDGLVTRANTGEQVLLPVWHNVTKNQVINYSPSLADKLARSTTTHTVEEIAREIVGVIGAS